MYYVKRLVFVAAAVYLVVCAYYFVRQESVIFYPERETTDPPDFREAWPVRLAVGVSSVVRVAEIPDRSRRASKFRRAVPSRMRSACG